LKLARKAATMATAATLTTMNGVPTLFLALPTAYPVQPGCSNPVILEPLEFVGWDPMYGAMYDRAAASCLPDQVTSWWNADGFATYGPGPTSTVLGPSFVCPGAYWAVATSSAANGLDQVFCCPSCVLSC
jgi:hypothetical protein